MANISIYNQINQVLEHHKEYKVDVDCIRLYFDAATLPMVTRAAYNMVHAFEEFAERRYIGIVQQWLNDNTSLGIVTFLIPTINFCKPLIEDINLLIGRYIFAEPFANIFDNDQTNLTAEYHRFDNTISVFNKSILDKLKAAYYGFSDEDYVK